MTEHESIFLSVLSDFINNKKTERLPDKNNECEDVLKIAEIHSLRAMCEYVLYGTTKNVQHQFMSSVQRIFAAEKLISYMEKNKIKLCVMKGFLIREYYPVPELRTFGDIDFLIRPEDKENVIALMASAGYERTPGEEHVMSFRKGIEYYEFHTSLIEETAFNEKTTELVFSAWDYTVPYKEYKYIYAFTNEFHIFYEILHIAKHFRCEGAGVRMFLDIAVLTGGAVDFSWEKLFEFFTVCEMCIFAKNIFYICKTWFAVNLPEIAVSVNMDTDLYNELCRFIMSGGTFGFCNRSFAVGELRREMSSSDKADGLSADNGKQAQVKAFINFLFPSYREMCSKYDFCKKSKLLIPVAYIVRFFEGVFKNNKRKKALSRFKGISSERDTAVKEYEMYKACGLDFLK